MMDAALKKKDGDVMHSSVAGNDPMRPRPFRVLEIWRELSDTFSMTLRPEDGGPAHFAPGQFNMLYVFGIGEVPISVSGDPGQTSVLVHTTRAVGKVSQALDSLKPGDAVGVRGPFGSFWPIDNAEGMDLVFIAGGIGLAPLRPAIYQAMANRNKFGNILVLYGARTPEDILFAKELARWRARFDIDVHVTVDRATGNWQGRVGLVTGLIASGYDPANAMAYTCGPEVMMRHVIDGLKHHGVAPERIFLSMERNMKCGAGLCGHCQWGTSFVCRDGPVYRYDQVAEMFNTREL